MAISSSVIHVRQCLLHVQGRYPLEVLDVTIRGASGAIIKLLSHFDLFSYDSYCYRGERDAARVTLERAVVCVNQASSCGTLASQSVQYGARNGHQELPNPSIY